METIWFAIVWGMLTVYVILDGFDFGVGILHFFVAKSDAERRTLLAAIGPVWDGNEVWLIASGGMLFMAFPRAYATAFSGFYLALMIVLWLLILRGASIEFRIHQQNPLWRQFWDAVFSVASTLLAVVFGTTLGNLVRGVPLDADGLSGMPLFTNFQPWGAVGVFDWYTFLVGLFTLFVLAGHGALFLNWRTSGDIQVRSRNCARTAWLIAAALWVLVTLATATIRRDVFANLAMNPWSLIFVVMAFGGMGAIFHFLKTRRELPAFLSSCLFLLGLLAATMVGNYPFWLRSTIDVSHSLTAGNTVAAHSGLQMAIVWWIGGITLAVGYFAYLFHSMLGKVDASEYGQSE